jgi:hypothetical protein
MMTMLLRRLYGTGAPAALARQRERYCDALLHFEKYLRPRPRGADLFGAPGRAELGGNHTDHQNGMCAGRRRQISISLPSLRRKAPCR